MKTNFRLTEIARYFLYTLLCAGVIGGCILLWNTTAYRDVAILEQTAPVYIEERGFTITSYDGFEGSMLHGGFVWYQARDEQGLLYSMAIGEWRGRQMLYNQTCLNAVSSVGK